LNLIFVLKEKILFLSGRATNSYVWQAVTTTGYWRLAAGSWHCNSEWAPLAGLDRLGGCDTAGGVGNQAPPRGRAAGVSRPVFERQKGRKGSRKEILDFN